MDEYKKNMDSFSTIFSEEKHNKLIERGERKLSHHALWGALFIWLNRDEPRFHLPYQLLSLLTDLDALINRWRCKCPSKPHLVNCRNNFLLFESCLSFTQPPRRKLWDITLFIIFIKTSFQFMSNHQS